MTAATQQTERDWTRWAAFGVGLAGWLVAGFVSFFVYEPADAVESVESFLQTYAVVNFLVTATFAGALISLWRPQVAGVLFLFAGLGGFTVVTSIGDWLLPSAVIFTAAVFAWLAGKQHSI